MRRFMYGSVLVLLTLTLVGGSVNRAHAQGLTGQIGGSVVDSSNAAIPGATVTVRNTGTAVTREAITDGQGLFVFTNLFAGTYDLRVSLSGFQTYEQTGIILSATERVAVPPIALTVGGVETTVTVEAAALRASTQSGERANTFRADEIQDTQLRGRDFLGLIQSMPGVIDTGTGGSGARNAPGWNAFLGTQINGLSDQMMGMSYDGVGSKDTGFGAANYVTPSLDSIAEVKVQTSNYQAEYGRAGGATIVVITKSGTSRFSGSGAYYKRHEALNSNTWERRNTCNAAAAADPSAPANPNCATPRYRYDNSAFTLGGPVLIPGTDFNRDRDKLFFFYSLDLMPRTDPFSVDSTFPTALERNGNFSQTFNNSGQLRYIRDPQSNGACNINNGGPGCFPNNTIPQDRIDPTGRQMLNIFPLPQDLWLTPEGRALSQGAFNYQFQGDTEKLRRDQVVRVDWNVRPGTTFYTRVQAGKEVFGRGFFNQSSPALIPGNGMGFAAARGSYDINTAGYVATLIHTFSPSTVFEVIAGLNWAEQDVYTLTEADRQAIDYSLVVPNHRQVFADNNPNRILPNMTFSGTNALTGTRDIAIGQGQNFPWLASNPSHNFSANLTHLRGAHNFKMGFFIEKTSRPGPFNNNGGSYNFSSNSQNPLDSNMGWSNALLGVLNSYSEGHNNQRSIPYFNQPEFFVQDNWRVTRTFTLDLGVRFSNIGNVYERDREIGWFVPSAYNPAAAVSLWQPHCADGVFPCTGNRSSQRVARNPITGEIGPNTWIGQIVEGSGDRNNGTVFGREFPDGHPSFGFKPQPRLGFGWDVTGDGKTAVRGGYGLNFNRLGDGQYGGYTGVTNPASFGVNWTTINDRFNAPVMVGPLGGQVIPEEQRAITIHSWSLGVQRELPWRLLADVSYVGNRTKNAFAVNSGQSYNLPLNDLNPIDRAAYNANPASRPEWTDPTTNAILPDNFIRPYAGRAAISQRQWNDDMFRQYHAIQFEIKRRLSSGLAWSVNYTGSLTDGYTSYDWFRTPEDNAARNTHRVTGNGGSRPHVLKVSYNWMIPGASQFLGNNPIAAGLLDGWQLSGLTQAVNGSYTNFSFTFTGAPSTDILTGGLGGMRPIIVCDPHIPRNERTLERQFRTECIQPAGPMTDASDILYQGTGVGRGQQDAWIGLGYVNHDMTLLKNFSMGNRRNLQVRLELYNVFNTAQLVNVDTSAVFNFATGAQTDAAFGRVTSGGARLGSERVGQVGVRFTF